MHSTFLKQQSSKSVTEPRNTVSIVLVACALAAFSVVFAAKSHGAQNNSVLGSVTHSRDGGLDPAYSSVIAKRGSAVYQAHVLSDGKILVAGAFQVVNGVVKVNFVRLNQDGTTDTTFAVDIRTTSLLSTRVRRIAVDSAGRILIGGVFGSVNGVIRPNFARLNADGTLDTSFNLGTGFNSTITAIALQSDGRILVGGDFTQFNGVGRSRLARLNDNGTLDTTLSSNITSSSVDSILSVAVLPDGKMFIQGRFSTVDSVGRPGGYAKLNSNGSLDATYLVPGTFSFFVSALVPTPDGKAYIGGSFEIQVGGQPVCRSLCRLNTDGSVDATFAVNLGLNGSADVLSLQPDGRLTIYGVFQAVNGTPRNRLARIAGDGSLDQSFAPDFAFANDDSINGFEPVGDGRMLLSGSNVLIPGSNVRGLARMGAGGILDSAFAPRFSLITIQISSVAQSDGKLLVTGDFDEINGLPCKSLVRLHPDGALDQTFSVTLTTGMPGSPFPTGPQTMTVQSDGKILIGGEFRWVNGDPHFGVARLNADGSTDPTFNTTMTSDGSLTIYAFGIQPDGRILVTGRFATVDGIPRPGYARLNVNGSLDASFVAPFSTTSLGELRSILVQPGGRVVMGGLFRFTGNNTQFSLVGLNSDGSIDPTFVVPVDPTQLPFAVYSIVRQPDGRLLVGGMRDPIHTRSLVRLQSNGVYDPSFVSPIREDGFSTDTIYSVLLMPNGKIVIGGSFSVFFNDIPYHLMRVLPNGARDYSFDLAKFRVENTTFPPSVRSLSLTSNGRLLATGRFDRLGEKWLSGIVRLQSFDRARQLAYDFDGDGKDDRSVFRPSDGGWYLLQSQLGFSGVQFGAQTDRTAPADFDGDGRTDICVFRDGAWYWLNSSDGSFHGVQFGIAGDIPRPADYDGDGKADQAVYRAGTWYVLQSQLGFTGFQFGNATDKPLTADFDGDGKSDAAVYRDGTWYLLRSQLGFAAVQFGIATDRPVVGDYDGDGKADQAVFRSGTWYVLGSTQGFYFVQFGIASDVPTPADYDGDGKTDPAVYRDGVWHVLGSQAGYSSVQFGNPGDQPVPAAYVP